MNQDVPSKEKIHPHVLEAVKRGEAAPFVRLLTENKALREAFIDGLSGVLNDDALWDGWTQALNNDEGRAKTGELLRVLASAKRDNISQGYEADDIRQNITLAQHAAAMSAAPLFLKYISSIHTPASVQIVLAAVSVLFSLSALVSGYHIQSDLSSTRERKEKISKLEQRLSELKRSIDILP